MPASHPYLPASRSRRLLLQSNRQSSQYGIGQNVRLICGTQGGLASNPVVTPTQFRVRMRYVREGTCSNPYCDRTELENGQWRKDAKGNQLCNACGLYSKTHHGAFRPRKVCERPYTTKRNGGNLAHIDSVEKKSHEPPPIDRSSPPSRSGYSPRHLTRKQVDEFVLAPVKDIEVLVPVEGVWVETVTEVVLERVGQEEVVEEEAGVEADVVDGLTLLCKAAERLLPAPLPCFHALLHTRPAWMYNLPPILSRAIAPPGGFLFDAPKRPAPRGRPMPSPLPLDTYAPPNSPPASTSLQFELGTPYERYHEPARGDVPRSASAKPAGSSGWGMRPSGEEANAEVKGVWLGHRMRED